MKNLIRQTVIIYTKTYIACYSSITQLQLKPPPTKSVAVWVPANYITCPSLGGACPRKGDPIRHYPIGWLVFN